MKYDCVSGETSGYKISPLSLVDVFSLSQGKKLEGGGFTLMAKSFIVSKRCYFRLDNC